MAAGLMNVQLVGGLLDGDKFTLSPMNAPFVIEQPIVFFDNDNKPIFQPDGSAPRRGDLADWNYVLKAVYKFRKNPEWFKGCPGRITRRLKEGEFFYADFQKIIVVKRCVAITATHGKRCKCNALKDSVYCRGHGATVTAEAV